MLNYLQVLVALGALLLEYEMFSNARRLYEGERKEVWKDILGHYPGIVVIGLMACSLGYLALSVVWMFSDSLPVRIAGICLTSLGILSLVASRVSSLERVWSHPVLFRTTSAISAASLTAVVIVKGCFS